MADHLEHLGLNFTLKDLELHYVFRVASGFIGITGTPEEVQKVANQYGGFFIKVESDSALEYLVEHTSKTYIISRDGEYVSILPHDMSSDDALNAIRNEL